MKKVPLKRIPTLLVVLIVALGVVRLLLVIERNRLLKEELEERSTELKKFGMKEEFPSFEVFEDLRNSKEELEDNYEGLKSFIDPPKLRLPKGVPEGGLYFVERLHDVQRELTDKAEEGEIGFPESLGFSESLPPEERVSTLLRQLEMTEEIVSLLLSTSVTEISFIQPLKIEEVKDKQTGEPLYKELPIQLNLACDTEALVKIIHQLKGLSPIYVIKSIHITQGPPQEKVSEAETEVPTEALNVDVLISGLSIIGTSE